MSSLERTVLELLLDRPEALLSIDEVVRYMTAGSVDFGERDAVEVAIRALVQAGLAHRLGKFVFPTLAAVTWAAEAQ